MTRVKLQFAFASHHDNAQLAQQSLAAIRQASAVFIESGQPKNVAKAKRTKRMSDREALAMIKNQGNRFHTAIANALSGTQDGKIPLIFFEQNVGEGQVFFVKLLKMAIEELPIILQNGFQARQENLKNILKKILSNNLAREQEIAKTIRSAVAEAVQRNSGRAEVNVVIPLGPLHTSVRDHYNFTGATVETLEEAPVPLLHDVIRRWTYAGHPVDDQMTKRFLVALILHYGETRRIMTGKTVDWVMNIPPHQLQNILSRVAQVRNQDIGPLLTHIQSLS